MMHDMGQGMVLVPLHDETVALLTKHRRAPGESIDDVIRRIARPKPREVNGAFAVSRPSRPKRKSSASGGSRYSVEVMGESVEENALGRLFANVVDLFHELDPQALENLAEMRARRRRYVARRREDVHGGRTNLPVIRTRSGWFVSANVGREDVGRGLRALCKAARLVCGVDVRFREGAAQRGDDLLGGGGP